MSRVAEALHKATGRAVFAGAGPLHEAPWGEWNDRPVARPAPLRRPRPVEPDPGVLVGYDRSPLDELPEPCRAELAALVRRLLAGGELARPALAFTAVEPGVPSAWVAAAAAQSLARQIQGTVCAIDASGPGHRLAEAFGLDLEFDLDDAAAAGRGTVPAAWRLGRNLWFLEAASADGVPTREDADRLLELLLAGYDTVIVHGEPAAPPGAPGPVALSAGSAVLVIDAEHTRRDVARAAAAALRACGARLAGAILLDREAAAVRHGRRRWF